VILRRIVNVRSSNLVSLRREQLVSLRSVPLPALALSIRSLVKPSVFRALSITTEVQNHGRQILLTFDDGPDPYVTPAVLERLNRFGARAVFFMVGSRIDVAPTILEAVMRAGHLIGNHSYSHDPELGYRAYVRDIQLCQARIQSLTGKCPTLFRPARGKITISALRAARRLDLKCMLWSLDRKDWKLSELEAGESIGGSLAVEALPGDIVLLHADNRCVLGALDVLLPGLVERGFDLSSACRALERARQ
jgi:peptidoglycan/xylan/chitin deacetylase (PgdA/CDA1 family)